MDPIRRRIVAAITAALMLLALPASAGTLTNEERADLGATFVAGSQKPNGSIPAFSPIGSTADAVLAFVAADTEADARRAALGFLRRQVRDGKVTTVGLQAKVVQAVVAAGRDPRAFGDVNIVHEIRGQIGGDGHIGDTAVFDQALAVLALEAAGVRPARDVTRWLLDAQCPVGGWSYDLPYAPGTDDDTCFDGSMGDSFTADTNTTAYVVMALEYVGRTQYSTGPFAFFRDARDATHGGWEYSPGFGTDANSTALVLQAYAAAGRNTPTGGLGALRALQDTSAGCGAWAYNYTSDVPGPPDVGATIGAIPGILRAWFPLDLGGAGLPRASRGC